MKKKNIIITVAVLVILSLLIYGLQIIIFHDPATTSFYILQDIAFIPISIAITTVVIGEIMEYREKQDSIRKTKMLTSTFFTQIGAELMCRIRKCREKDGTIVLTRESFEGIRDHIEAHRMELLVLSSNPLLMDQESFTKLLWGIFHLLDEYRVRGDYTKLSVHDIEHYQEDIEKVSALLDCNWKTNQEYLKTTYPDFYGAAFGKNESKKK